MLFVRFIRECTHESIIENKKRKKKGRNVVVVNGWKKS